MNLSSAALVIGVVGTGTAALALGGTVGAGALAGGLLGLAISAGSVAKQRRALIEAPREAMTIFLLAALVKLVAVGIGGALLRYVEALASRADWVSFLIAFPIAALWMTSLGAVSNMKVLERRTA